MRCSDEFLSTVIVVVLARDIIFKLIQLVVLYHAFEKVELVKNNRDITTYTSWTESESPIHRRFGHVHQYRVS